MDLEMEKALKEAQALENLKENIFYGSCKF